MTLKSRSMVTFSALQVRDVRVYCIGQIVSVSGTWMQRVAQGWLVYQLTGSALGLGAAAFASGLPALLLMPFAGVWADRYPRHIILLVTQAVELFLALILGTLTITGQVKFEHIIACALALGITAAIGEPARVAFMREITGREALNSGLAMNALIANGASVIGPAFAGLLLVSIGAGWCFILNGVSYLAVIVSLLIIHPEQPAGSPKHSSPLRGLREGFAYVLQHPHLAYWLLMTSAVNIVGTAAFYTLMPAFATVALGDGKVGYATLSTATGIGAVVGAVISIPLGTAFGLERIQTINALLWTGLTVVLAATTQWIPALVLCGMLGFVYCVFFTVTNILIQTHTDDLYRGRVMALWTLNRFAFSPLGALLISAVADGIGIPATWSFCAVGGVAIMLVMRYQFAQMPRQGAAG
jgi:MFS family permease